MIQFPLTINNTQLQSTEIYNEYKKTYNKDKTINYIINTTQCTHEEASEALEEILELARPKPKTINTPTNHTAKTIDCSNNILCPKCNSSNNSITTRGFSLLFGFIGSASPRRICNQCGYKWKP